MLVLIAVVPRPAAIVAIAVLLAFFAAGARSQTPPPSTFFSTAAEEAYSTYQVPGSGDLWPSCWADDDNLYTANGDGTGFYKAFVKHDLMVSRISGMPPQLSGTSIAKGVGTNWMGNAYSRKPTGMLCINSTIYLAFQNLQNTTFDSAPAASIAKSTDYGVTWTWDASAPMFGGAGKPPLFTTIFFLDYGKNSNAAMDQYVYAYGLDNNWRSQQAFYLARVPAGNVQTRSAWQFYTGTDANGIAAWTGDITRKNPVLLDTRLLYPVMFGSDCPPSDAVIAQGGVVYDKPLQRYLFASWSCSTHEIYEAPAPWGPWRHVLSNDFGPLRLTQNRGQYGTNIPSKFISADGKTLMLQSNICCSGDSYTFSLRKLYLDVPAPTTYPANNSSNANLALAPGVRAVSKSTHLGSLCGVNCSNQLNSGILTASENDFDEETKSTDWWGFMWPQPYNLDEVVYQTGGIYADGGWFSGNLQVQVYQNNAWVTVPNVTVSPAYPYSNLAGVQATYTFDFPSVSGSGVRIVGTPGGSSHFSSIGQLGIYFGGRNLVADPGFEGQGSSTLMSPWSAEGPDTHSVDVATGSSHSGANDGLVRSSSSSWNALTQKIAVTPGTTYTLTGWVQNNFTTGTGAIGVRGSDGVSLLKASSFGSGAAYVPVTVTFNSGSNLSVTLFAGFNGQKTDLWIRVDDFAIR